MNSSSSTLFDVIWEKTFIWRTLLYAVTPSETSPMSVEETPDLVGQIIPIFFILIVTEAICCQLSSGRFRNGMIRILSRFDKTIWCLGGSVSEIVDGNYGKGGSGINFNLVPPYLFANVCWNSIINCKTSVDTKSYYQGITYTVYHT